MQVAEQDFIGTLIIIYIGGHLKCENHRLSLWENGIRKKQY